MILKIDRSRPFEPSKFMGRGWGLAEPADARSLALTEIDTSSIELVTHLKEGEQTITGTERLRRIITVDQIPLDPGVLQAFLEHKRFIPQCFKGKGRDGWSGYTRLVLFEGQALISPTGEKFSIYLFLQEWGAWSWQAMRLDDPRREQHLSAVLSKVAPVERPEFAGGGWNTKGSIH